MTPRFFCVPCDKFFKGASVAASCVCPDCGRPIRPVEELADYLQERERRMHNDRATERGRRIKDERAAFYRRMREAERAKMNGINNSGVSYTSPGYAPACDLSRLSANGRKIRDIYAEATGKSL